MTDQMPFTLQVIPVTPFQQNCSILRAPSGAAAIIDPGGEPDKLLHTAKEMDATIEKIWLTHGHLDHAGAAAQIRRVTDAVIEGPHKDEIFWLDQIRACWAQMGWEGGEDVRPDRWLTDGDQVTLDDISFNVVHTPGHTPGHVVFYHTDANLAFVGDVLFKGSIGRTDFPKSNPQALVDSITRKLWPLGDVMRFIPGHGPMSSFGAERQSNPFVSDDVLGASG